MGAYFGFTLLLPLGNNNKIKAVFAQKSADFLPEITLSHTELGPLCLTIIISIIIIGQQLQSKFIFIGTGPPFLSHGASNIKFTFNNVMALMASGQR